MSVETAIVTLRGQVKGTILTPGSAEYDTARRIAAGGTDPRPAALVQVRDAADVRSVINTVRQENLPFAIRSGGHSSAMQSNVDEGIVIDVRRLKSIEIDAGARTVWAGAGVTAGELTEATLEHGLAVGFGDAPTVGISGITLGGGVGYLSRKLGLTIDSLLAVEIVTAEGQVLKVDSDNEPDLFWALRGGGGNFGVVTRLKYRLTELTAFTGGMLCLPVTPEVLAGFVAAADASPDALSTIANVMTAPPLPFLPAELHGRLVILAMMAFAGPEADAVAALAPFRALAVPYADFIQTGSYMQMYPPEDGDYHPTAVARTLFMNHIGIDEARNIVSTLENSTAQFRVTQIRVLGGAIARVPAEATAYAHRDAPIMINVAAFYTTPDDRVVQDKWVTDFAAALTQEHTGAYVNFIGLEGPDRINAAYPPATLARLRAIKKRYDPENLFRRNQNFAPAD
jgi:FAD/FMN-containing dehydrogenase